MKEKAPYVTVNGITYVPMSEQLPTNHRAVQAALLEQFWGDVSPSITDEELARIWKDVFITVHDDNTRGGVKIDEFLETLTLCTEQFKQ
jgi:hypothetical protein